MVHGDDFGQNVEPLVRDRSFEELTYLQFAIKFVFTKCLKDHANVCFVFLLCFGVNENVVQVGYHETTQELV